MAKIPRSAEKGFAVSCLLLSTAALTLLRQGSNADAAESASDPLLLAIWLGIYLVTLLLLLAVGNRSFKVVGQDKLIWALVGIALFSTFWSTVPMVTLRRSVVLVGTTLFGIYLATRYSLNEQLRLLAWALGIGAVLSLVVAVGIPSYGIEATGAWRGIYTQKNVLARLMVLGAMVFLLVAFSSRRHRWIPWAMFGLSTGLTVLSASKTALVNLITLVALLILYRALRLHYTRAIPLLIFAILAVGSAGSLLTSNAEILLKSLGKDATLTGRTDLWDAVLEMIWKRPILGYGYNGFWTVGSKGPAVYVWNAIEWQANHSHNGILNLWLDLGLLGVSVYVLGYLMLTMRSVNLIRSTKTVEGFWPLVYISFTFLYNQTESSLMIENTIFWIIYTALSFSVPIQEVQPRKTVYLSTQK